jgi:uracil-DNA glycosylase family 4
MKKAEYDMYDKFFPNRADTLSLGTDCNLCQKAGFQFCGKDIVWGNGNRNSDLLIAGQDSAGADPKQRLWKASRITLFPLSNKKTGAKFRIFLHKAGFNPFDVFITNVVKCNTGYDTKSYTFKDLFPYCSQHLRWEIETIRPKVIISLGGKATEAIKKLLDVFEPISLSEFNDSGLLNPHPPCTAKFGKLNIKIVPMCHPSRVEGVSREGEYVENLQAVNSLLREEMKGINGR